MLIHCCSVLPAGTDTNDSDEYTNDNDADEQLPASHLKLTLPPDLPELVSSSHFVPNAAGAPPPSLPWKLGNCCSHKKKAIRL
jgi:hypothetical protein